MSFVYAQYDAAQDGPVTRMMKGNAQQGIVINNLRVVGPRQTGFAALTGTLAANKATVALNTVAAAAAAPTKAEYDALVTEHNKLAANYRALHDALRAHGLIG